ncbi:MAG: hypothetical protein DHS20C15_13030 [Planctomycetota bacterium]|nr:MAG: hypothetical protein DHS20C15_13030 [Planctomycetota bacterium]
MLRSLLAVATLFVFTAALSAQMSLDEQRASYPLDVCAVSGEAFEASMKPVEKEHAGTLVRLCCDGCVRGYDKDPDAVVASVRAAVIADQKPRYPLTTCVVTGEELGESAVDHVFGTRLVRVKDAAAAKEFDKNWGRLIGKLDDAWIEAGRASYPLTTCIVSEEPLDEPAKEILYGTRLVRVCCKGCVKEFHANPPRILAQLDARAKELAAKRERAASKKPERKQSER